MPTGYTADVQSGKIETLEDYAWVCARAFGALVMMRDDSSDTPIPERFEPEISYHEKALTKARQDLCQEWKSESCAQVEFDQAILSFEKSVKESNSQLSRYESMLSKVRDWDAPFDHKGMKNFMIEQLEKSIEHDCYTPERPIKKTGEKWLETKLINAAENIRYHDKKIAEETVRTENRNTWLADLRKSLEAHK